MLQWIHRIRKVSLNKTTARRIFLWAVVFVFLSVLSPHFALAQGTVVQQSGGVGADIIASNNVIAPQIGLPSTDIRVIIARIIRVALSLLGIILVCIILYGGFLYMTSGGSEEKIANAKRIIINGVIGLAIILSSYAITLFVINMFGLDTAGGGGDNNGGVSIAVSDQNFYGSGGLGSVIRDHYPGRDQQDVPRNAKIIITFRRAILPSSFVIDSNRGAANGTFGDCVNMGSSMNWETDCDRLNMGTDLINITRTDTNAPIRGASVLASVETGGVFTVVIRPWDALGSDTDKIGYLVRVGKGITWNDATNNNPSIFAGRPSGRDFYSWNFITDTVLDRTAPHVTSVFPGSGVTETRNSIIQVNFDKPMDPSAIQGALVQSASYFNLSNNAIFVRSANSTLPAGSFRLVNNYQTLEFTPSSVCGQNACGGTVYCMPVCDRAGATCSTDAFTILLRSARTFSASSFEAIPFTGVTDVSGNALDGNNNNAVDPVTTTVPVFPNQQTGDNYFWNYNLSSAMDISAPILTQTTPGPNATFIQPGSELSMTFDKRLRADSLYNILLNESPASGDPLCFVPRAYYQNNGTYVRLDHCPFLSATRHYYYPSIDSSVEDVHFNCFYPGKGPTQLSTTSTASNYCNPTNLSGCCPATVTPTSTAYCCNGAIGFPDRQSCLNALNTP
jgi:hypothetical protein